MQPPRSQIRSTKIFYLHPMMLTIDPFILSIQEESSYSLSSTDNVNLYEHVYGNASDHSSTRVGLVLKQEEQTCHTRLLCADGGPTGVHERMVLVEENFLLVAVGNSVFCLTLPELSLIWQTRADEASCFQLFAWHGGILVHGELNITYLSRAGNILWQFQGPDIFTTPEGFAGVLTDQHFRIKDWTGSEYKLDVKGKLL